MKFLNPLKNLGTEVIFFIFRMMLSVFILIGFWTFIASLGKIDLIRYFLDRILDRLWRE